ncbi:unnamed protein product, partial [Rotaria sp. Silwood2]
VRGYPQYAENEKVKLVNRMKQNSLRQNFTEQLIHAIEQRQKHIQQHMQYFTKRCLHFFLPSLQRSSTEMLAPEQLTLLSRGSKYVSSCQSQFYKKEKNQIIEEEHKNIIGTIEEFFRQRSYCISEKRIKEFSLDLQNLLQCLYTKKLARKLSLRAKREHKLIMSIHCYLQKYQQVILRRTDKSKVFHLGDANDYQRKVREYMQETEAYEEIPSGISPLAVNLKQIGTPLRPIVAGIHAPATLVSQYLDELLRPIFNRVARKTIYIDSMDLAKQLENHRNEGHLLSTTKFVTAVVKNLYTMIPKGGALDALYRFCVKHDKDHTNCFVFDNKYYKQIRSGAMGSPFTITLVNIYMYEWEQSLIEHQQQRNELYGRYIDDIFMTSNEPINNIKALLDRENEKDPNIKINYTIHESVEFLDVLIENIQGQLKTSVFRKPAAEPYMLPYTSDRPRYIHSNTIHTALFCGIRLCSDAETFDQNH